MVIYQIRNRINGKSYVGQAKNGFYRRYNSRSWWKHVDNTHLQNSIRKYGHEAFEVIWLEQDVASAEELDRLEREHIARVNCLHPNGYNYQSGGQLMKRHHRETRDRAAAMRSGGRVHRLLNNRTGVTHEFTNIARFAEENGLSGPMLTVLLNRKESRKIPGEPYYVHHRGWSLPDRRPRRILCTGPQGEQEVIIEGVDGGIKGFCKRRGFRSTSNVIATIKGEYEQAYGWHFKILNDHSS